MSDILKPAPDEVTLGDVLDLIDDLRAEGREDDEITRAVQALDRRKATRRRRARMRRAR